MQWVQLQVPHWLTPFSATRKKISLINVLLILNLWFTNITLTILLFCLNLKENLKLFVNYMNSKHRNIKFAVETEDCNNFSFLDVKITWQNKRFVTSIFRKATFSGALTNYDRFIFDTYKIGLVHTLLFKFFKICSSTENFHIEIELLRSICKCNNYPVNIIDECIKKLIDKLYVLNRLYQ